MQTYVKTIFLKRIIKILTDKGEVTYDDIKRLTDLPDEYIEKLLLMLENYYNEVETEHGISFVPTESAYALRTIDDSFWRNLPGFDDFKMFEKEIEVLKNGEPLYVLAKAISRIHKGDKKLIVLAILSGLSPWVGSEIIHLWPLGRSGKGKTDLCSSTLIIIPSYAKDTISSTSPLAIYYASKSGLLDDNKILFFDDVKTNPVFVEVIKTFSGGIKVRPRHWTVDERRRFIDIKPEHKYSIWLTSVKPVPDEQLKNRFVLANVDESISQDLEVWKHIDKIYRKGMERKILESKEFEFAKNIVNILIQEPVEVIVPYKIKFPILFDRRSYIYFISALKTAAFINKFQRKKVGNQLLATRQDFEVVKSIWKEIGKYQFLKIDADSYRILSVLGVGVENALSYSEIIQKIKEKFGVSISRQKVASRCQKDLSELNLVSGEKIGIWKWWINSELSVDLDLESIKSFKATEEDLKEFGINPDEKVLNYINKVKQNKILEFMEGENNDGNRT